MLVQGKYFRTIWLKDGDDKILQIIDQRFLPHRFVIEDLKSVDDVIHAIKDMHVRGAGLIGAAAGYGMYLAALEASDKGSFDDALTQMALNLKSSRPTAVNLEWAVNRQLKAIDNGKTIDEKFRIAKTTAVIIADEDAGFCKSIGLHGVKVIEEISERKKDKPVNILTHCNAGWLAFTDFGTATSPIYEAFNRGLDVHVWVDETRPRNQGANLTAWELLNQGIPHTIIVDNTGGHLMQNGKVDMVITGADRVTRTGDVANKIGTYLKALAARDNHLPFYVAIPSSTIDWNIRDGKTEIPIEERGEEEVKYIQGKLNDELIKVLIAPEQSPAANYGFDITPA
ncbi:MAG: S-methyl-5-thioribose-1-phosphate isomerase, partial [Candidatus Neomarinimicrobiota bacterium]